MEEISNESFIETIRPYENKWVALVNDKVIASGESPQEVAAHAQQAGYTDYTFHLVPSFSHTFIPLVL